MYQTGHGWVPDEIVTGAPVLTLFQNPGAEEEIEGRPTVGKTGQWVARHLHPPAGLTRGVNVSIANVLKCRWRRWVGMGKGGMWEGTNSLPPEPILTQAMAHCTSAYLRMPPGVEVVVACGELAHRYVGARVVGMVHVWRPDGRQHE